MKELDCRGAEEARLSLASGPPEPETRLALEAHEKTCERCRRFSAEITALESRLSETLREVANQVEVGASFPVAARTSSAPRAFCLGRQMLVAAVVLVACGLGVWLLEPPSPRIGRGSVLAAKRASETFPLPGRATVTIGAGSRAVLVETRPRVLRLERGKAFFSVPESAEPFEVTTALGAVSAVPSPPETRAGSRENVVTEFQVELLEESTTMKTSRVAAGAAAVLGVGVVSGAVLLRPIDGQPVTVGQGHAAFADSRGKVSVLDLEQARKSADAIAQIATLQAALERSNAHTAELEAKLAALESQHGSDSQPAATEKPRQPAPDAVANEAARERAEADRKVAELVKKVDWTEATQALVALMKAQRKGQNPDFKIYQVLTNLNVAVSEIGKARGLDNPYAAYGDPLVQEQFVPAWYNALGCDLDPAQTETLRKQIRDQGKTEAETELSVNGQTIPKDPTVAPPTYLDRLATKVTQEITQEQSLQQMLRPDQYARYLETVGDDPFFGQSVPTKRFTESTADALVTTVSQDLASTFELGDAARQAARTATAQYVQQAVQLGLPDSSLDPSARRLAFERRAQQLLGLQRQLEATLAVDPSLSDDEKARVKAGSSAWMDVRVKG